MVQGVFRVISNTTNNKSRGCDALMEDDESSSKTEKKVDERGERQRARKIEWSILWGRKKTNKADKEEVGRGGRVTLRFKR